MRLTVQDTILVTSIRQGKLERGEVVTVSEAEAAALLSSLPSYFVEVPEAGTIVNPENEETDTAQAAPGKRRKAKA